MAKFVDDDYWMNRAHEEATNNRKLKYQHGKGPCVMFALDTSASMQGVAFQEMKKAFTDIIDEYAKGPMDENVAVLTFGEEVKFRHYYSNNYQSLKRCLEDVRCCGPSPIEAAITLCLSGLHFGGGHTQGIAMFEVRAKLVLITDGKPTTSNVLGGEEDQDVLDPVETRKSLMNLTGTIGRVTSLNCIPVGNDPDFCLLGSIAYSSRGGKLIQPQQARQYGRYHLNMVKASQILRSMPSLEISHVDKKQAICSSGIMNQSSEEDMADVLEIINERSSYKSESDEEDNEEAENFEYDPQMLPLGTRVKRGPDWVWGDQDCAGPGTVVEHSEMRGVLQVKWDGGMSLPYRYGNNGLFESYDVVECGEPRILKDDLIAEGCPDWRWGDQDGGIGNLGVVYKVKRNAIVYVRWSNSNKSNYRYGYDGKFDVRLCDPFETDVVRRFQQQKRAAAGKLPFKTASDVNIRKESSQDETNTTNSQLSSPSAKSQSTASRLSSQRGNNPLCKTEYEGDEHHDELETECPSTDKWQFKGEDGQWENFPEEIHQKIDTNYRKNNRATVLVNMNDSWFRIVLSKMKKIEIETRQTTDIRFLKREHPFP